LIFMCAKSCQSAAYSGKEPRARSAKVEAGFAARASWI
jgi:hypothetical protein